jgi:hypothetical protein
MKGNLNSSIRELKAFKRVPLPGLSQWENGNLTTNLAEEKDTNGAFFLLSANSDKVMANPKTTGSARV